MRLISTAPHPRPTRGNPSIQRDRFIKRFVKSLGYRQAALSGGGDREVVRRQVQIMLGKLQVA